MSPISRTGHTRASYKNATPVLFSIQGPHSDWSSTNWYLKFGIYVKLNCRREATWHSMSLKILLSNSRSCETTMLSRAWWKFHGSGSSLSGLFVPGSESAGEWKVQIPHLPQISADFEWLLSQFYLFSAEVFTVALASFSRSNKVHPSMSRVSRTGVYGHTNQSWL